MKSIAEILGWEDRYESWTDGDTACSGHLTYGPDGERRYPQSGPTPDDMLAWLREWGYDIEIGTAHDSTEVGVEVSKWDDWHECDVATDHYAPTLHAALEAAVRAVHDAEEAK